MQKYRNLNLQCVLYALSTVCKASMNSQCVIPLYMVRGLMQITKIFVATPLEIKPFSLLPICYFAIIQSGTSNLCRTIIYQDQLVGIDVLWPYPSQLHRKWQGRFAPKKDVPLNPRVIFTIVWCLRKQCKKILSFDFFFN